jgi:NTP pyrophosphatase (non-canonical NTP hydrolase)
MSKLTIEELLDKIEFNLDTWKINTDNDVYIKLAVLMEETGEELSKAVLEDTNVIEEAADSIVVLFQILQHYCPRDSIEDALMLSVAKLN